MDIEKFISKAKQDYEMQKCWNDTDPQTHWEWIEMHFRQLYKESRPVEQVVMPKVADACIWKFETDKEGYLFWYTKCGYAYEAHDNPEFIYCPYCGKAIDREFEA